MKNKTLRRRVYDAVALRFDEFFGDDLVGELAAVGKLNEAKVSQLEQLVKVEHPMPYDRSQIMEFIFDYESKEIPEPFRPTKVDPQVVALSKKLNLKFEDGSPTNTWDAAKIGFEHYGFDMEQVCKFQKAEADVVGALSYATVNHAIDLAKQGKAQDSIISDFNIGLHSYRQLLRPKDAHIGIHAVPLGVQPIGHLSSIREHYKRQMREAAKVK